MVFSCVVVRSCGGPVMCSRVVDLAWCSCLVAIRVRQGAVRGHSGAFRGIQGVFGGSQGAVRGHSGVRGHVVSRQGPLGGQSGNRGYAPDTHTMYLIAHSLQPIPHTRCPMSPYHILDTHCLIPDTLIPLCPMAHTRYWFLFHTPSHMT